ncbi:hypothetical protein X011_25565 [Mycobacterium tuberculosis variant microti OV254]|nr:hypothetical protein X011_25565 [Mycobacterium tuberculosis variant microti OV254]BBX38908.1 hypothetical protein MSIM_03590 [Mycobacterium simiae]
MPAPEVEPPGDYCGSRTVMMPRRTRTRAQDRATRITTERRRNRDARTARREERASSYVATVPPKTDEEPPPF